MTQLARSGFATEAMYLAVKAAGDDPKLQQELLQQLVFYVNTTDAFDGSFNNEATQRYMDVALEMLPTGFAVKAGKLPQLSWQGGFSWRHQKYAESARKNAEAGDLPFLAAHAALIGLPSFIREYERVSAPFYILNDHFIENQTMAMCGYEVSNGRVSFLPKDFERQRNSVVICDTVRTGTTLKVIEDFWTQDGRYPSPRTEALVTNSGF